MHNAVMCTLSLYGVIRITIFIIIHIFPGQERSFNPQLISPRRGDDQSRGLSWRQYEVRGFRGQERPHIFDNHQEVGKDFRQTLYRQQNYRRINNRLRGRRIIYVAPAIDYSFGLQSNNRAGNRLRQTNRLRPNRQGNRRSNLIDRRRDYVSTLLDYVQNGRQDSFSRVFDNRLATINQFGEAPALMDSPWRPPLESTDILPEIMSQLGEFVRNQQQSNQKERTRGRRTNSAKSLGPQIGSSNLSKISHRVDRGFYRRQNRLMPPPRRSNNYFHNDNKIKFFVNRNRNHNSLMLNLDDVLEIID